VNLTLALCQAWYEVPCRELMTEGQKIRVFVGIRSYFLTVLFVCHDSLYVYWSDKMVCLFITIWSNRELNTVLQMAWGIHWTGTLCFWGIWGLMGDGFMNLLNGGY
jgi:hypothetical protein